jgi:hypothetical protein
MTCEACGGPTAIVDTRGPDAPEKHKGAIRQAEALVGWYTSDWVARRRVCKTCKMSTRTIEVACKDFVYMRDNKEKKA